MSINIFQVPKGSNISLGCGCGPGGSSGGGSSGGGLQLPPGGTMPLPAGYDGAARVIDLCANVDIIQDRMQQWINAIQTNGYIPGGVEAIFGEDILSFFMDNLSQLEQELYGDEYTTALKRWIVNRWPDPIPRIYRPEGVNFMLADPYAEPQEGVSNHDLTVRWPFLVAGAPFSIAVNQWLNTANLEELNAAIRDIAGTASLTGECAQLQREAGREPYQPPASNNSVIVLEDANYKYTRVLAGTTEINGTLNATYSGEGYVGQLTILETTAADGTGTAVNPTTETTNTQGTVTETGGIGSGNTPGTEYRAGGEENIGQTAAAASAAYFSGFSGVTNPQEPSGATYPDAGAFTGTFDITNALDTQTRYELWLVTSLEGSASAG